MPVVDFSGEKKKKRKTEWRISLQKLYWTWFITMTSKTWNASLPKSINNKSTCITRSNLHQENGHCNFLLADSHNPRTKDADVQSSST